MGSGRALPRRNRGSRCQTRGRCPGPVWREQRTGALLEDAIDIDLHLIELQQPVRVVAVEARELFDLRVERQVRIDVERIGGSQRQRVVLLGHFPGLQVPLRPEAAGVADGGDAAFGHRLQRRQHALVGKLDVFRRIRKGEVAQLLLGVFEHNPVRGAGLLVAQDDAARRVAVDLVVAGSLKRGAVGPGAMADVVEDQDRPVAGNLVQNGDGIVGFVEQVGHADARADHPRFRSA